MNEPTTAVSVTPALSIRKAYLWLLTLFFGAHRFYVGKRATALIYPFLLVVITFSFEVSSLAIYVLWFYLALLLLDACLIPGWVRQRNEWYQQDILDHPNRYLIPDSDDIAPWARGQLKKDSSSLTFSILRTCFFFWIIPLVTGIAAAEIDSLEVLMIPVIVLIAIGLISSLDKMLEHQPALMEIPGMGPSLERVAAMRAYFWNNEPKIGKSFLDLFRNWKDYKPYWTLALIVAVTIVIEGVLSFNSNYENIDNFEAAKIIGIAALIAGTVVLVNLVPLTALSFHYSLSGKRTRLKLMTIGAVVAAFMGYQIPSWHLPTAVLDSEGNKVLIDSAGKKAELTKRHGGQLPSWISKERLDQRMKDETFRQELIEKMDVFLWYYVNLDIDEEELNRDFRNLLLGLTPNDEADAFEIIEFEEWAAILYFDDSGTCSLLNPDIADEQSPKYSILAIAIKNTDEFMQAKLDLALNDPVYEQTPILKIVEFVSSKSIHYEWDDVLEPYLGTRSANCSDLLCDKYGECPWLESDIQAP